MISVSDFIKEFPVVFPAFSTQQPWEITSKLWDVLPGVIASLSEEFIIKDNIAIHKTATIEEGTTLKGPLVIGANCFIGAHAYLRGGVYLSDSVSIGPGCEIKSSIIMSHSSSAHFNFIGDSIIGSYVNLEAGAIIANHYNERKDKAITVRYEGKVIATNIEKFGALVGDHSKIGANAVLTPGSILPPYSIVKRLELIDQASNPHRV